MPRVPIYEPQAQVNAGPTVRLSQDQFNSGSRGISALAEDLTQASGNLGKVAQQMQDREDADLTFRAQTSFATEASGFETKALESRGQNAWGLQDKGRQAYDEAARKASEVLKTPRQQRLFQNYVAQQRLAGLNRLARHEAEQRRVSLDDSTTASMMADIDTAVASGGEQKAIDDARAGIRKRNMVRAQLNGWDSTKQDFETSAMLNQLHSKVIDRLADSDPAGAKAYFEVNKGEITGTTLTGVEKTLKQSGLKTTAQTFADKVRVDGLDETAALARARKELSGDEEAAAVIEIKTRFAEDSALREKDQKDAADEAYGIFARTGNVSSIPSRVLARMDGKTLLALKKDAAGENAITDWNRYAELRSMALNEPGKFKALDLRKEFGHLAPTQREALLDLQSKKPDHLTRVRSIDGQIAATLRPLGIEKADATVAEDIIRAEIDAEPGAKDDPKKVQAIIDRMVLQGEVRSGHWYLPDPNKRYYQVQPEDQGRFVVNVPSADRDRIKKRFLERKGYEPSDKQISDIYTLTVQ